MKHLKIPHHFFTSEAGNSYSPPKVQQIDCKCNKGLYVVYAVMFTYNRHWHNWPQFFDLVSYRYLESHKSKDN